MFHAISLRRAAAFVAGALVLAQPLAAMAQAAVTPPVVESHVDAVYPASAVASGKHADVVLAVTVDTDGHVSRVDVLQSGGDDLDQAAIVAVRQWTFTPAMRGGTAVASRIRVPFHFAPPAPPPEVVAPEEGAPSTPPGGVVSSGAGGASSPLGQGESPAHVEAAPAPPSKTAEAPSGEQRPDEQHPDTVTVFGRAPTPNRGASDFNFHIGALNAVPRQNAAELLKLAPGILLTNEGGEGHAEQVFLRGFDAREGQDVEFSVGGVPINEPGNLHGNGVADTHFIIPELVHALRVIEGPFDPRQGNFAVAGSADYELGLDRRGLTASYMRGSWDTQRMLLLWGPKGESSRTFAGAELYSTQGYGQNRDASRGSAMAQYEGRIGARASYRITAQGYATHYHSAGLIREDDYDAGKKGFFDTYDPRQGGDASRWSVAGDIESRTESAVLRQSFFFIRRGMRLDENFTGFLLDTQTPLQNPHGQRGDLLDLNVDESTVGARGSAMYRTDAFGQHQELELGYFFRDDAVDGTQYRIEAATGHPYKLDTSLESNLGDIGLYGDANLAIGPYLKIRGGARADLFTFNVLDRCAVQSVAHPSKSDPPGDASCLSQQDFGNYREPVQRASTASTAVLPRASVLWGPFEKLTFSVSYGRGVRSVDPNYVTQDTQTPFASIVSYEGGVAYAGGSDTLSVVARSVFFQTHVDRDLIFSETEGRNVLGNGTTRTGWIGAVRVTGTHVDEAANVTLVKSTEDDPPHLLVPYVPAAVIRSDTSLFSELPLRVGNEKARGSVGAGVSYVGHRPLPYGQQSDTLFTIDGSATLSFHGWEVGVVATNLLDRRYRLGEYNFASDFDPQSPPTLVPVRHFTAGAPRSVFFHVSATLGGV